MFGIAKNVIIPIIATAARTSTSEKALNPRFDIFKYLLSFMIMGKV
jgi:hypothetical protein